MARIAIKVVLGPQNKSDGSYNPVATHFDPTASVTGDVFVGYDNTVITQHNQLAQALLAVINAAGGNAALKK